MVTPDETVRQESVRTVQAALRLAGWLGARGIDTGPGSMNPDGPWSPHPDNWTETARRQLVKTLKECTSAAEDAGVYLSLESHQLGTLQTPEITKAILDEVGSPWVRLLGDLTGTGFSHRCDKMSGLLRPNEDHRGAHRPKFDPPLSARHGPAGAGAADRTRATPSAD